MILESNINVMDIPGSVIFTILGIYVIVKLILLLIQGRLTRNANRVNNFYGGGDLRRDREPRIFGAKYR